MAPAVHRHTHEQLDLRHLERRRVTMPHEVSNQRSVVRDLLRPGAVTDACRLNDRTVVAHHIDKADESIVKHLEFLPAQVFDKFRV